MVLDALLTERHVTRAGRVLGLSQSATSNALERLRALFHDPILERIRGVMVPTPTAQALRSSLEDALAGISKVIAPRSDLATLARTIRWSVLDYGIALLAPRSLGGLRKTAPGIDLVVTPWAGADEALAQVYDGALDLVVTVMAQGATALRCRAAVNPRAPWMRCSPRAARPAAWGWSCRAFSPCRRCSRRLI